MTMESSSPHRVLILSMGELASSGHLVKLAQTFTDSGLRVTTLGFKTAADDPDTEESDRSEIVRLGLGSSSGPRTGYASSPNAPLGLRVRDRAKSLLFRFEWGRRLRERVLMRRAYSTFMDRNDQLSERACQLSPDLVIAMQLTTLAAGARVSRTLGIPLVYDCRDIAVESGWSGFDERRFAGLERRLIPAADLVVAASPRMAARLAELYGVPMPAVIYNGSLQRAAQSTCVHEPVRLLFQGRFAENRRLPELLEAVQLLKDRVVLTLQGWGDVEVELRRLVGELNLEGTVHFAAPVPPTDASLAASDHDIGIISYLGSTANLRTTLPMKLFDYLGGGLAIAASDLPALRDVVEAEQCGVLFDPDSTESIVEKIGELLDQPGELARMKARSLSSWAKYSWEEQGLRYLEHIRVLLAPAGGR